MSRKAYQTDVNDQEWAFVAPYLTLIREDAVQRLDPWRELFDAVRSLVKAGGPWRLLPNALPPRTAGAPAGRTLEEGGRLCSDEA